MTDPVDRTHVPMPESRPDDLDFEVETETMADRRQIHYYRWPEPGTVPADAQPTPMSERRWNPVLGEWVITATHRQDRTFLPPAEFCPLCPTRPGGPPTEIGRADVEIAVFDNRFPSLRPDPEPPAVEGTELTPVAPSFGACEVVVYTPEHSGTFGSLGVGHIRRLISVWAHRTLVLGARDEVAYVYAFENRGEEIGVNDTLPKETAATLRDLPPREPSALEAAS
jgi:UDPglucose--hexose-1-phosphate uridylyltransferase